jgi:hypothetical protein
MSEQTDLIRALIADDIQFDRTEATADGFSTDFAVANAPVAVGSEKVYDDGILQATPAQYAIDYEPGVVTFVAPPTVGHPIIVVARWSYLSDAKLARLLGLSPDNVLLAAANALDAMATSEAIVQKLIKLNDLSTNGPAVAKTLREHATELRRQADAEGGGFDIAEQVVNMPSFRERLIAMWARTQS